MEVSGDEACLSTVGDLLRSAIRSASEPRLVAESVDDLVSLRRMESVAAGSRCLDPILDENCRTRELSGVVSTLDPVELLLGDGVVVRDRPVAGVESPAGGLDGDCLSRRAVMRSVRDCRPVALRPSTLDEELSGVGLGDAPAPIRPPMPLVASRSRLLRLLNDCNDLLLNELRLSGPILVPMELLPIEGVWLGPGVLTDGRDGLNVYVRSRLGDGLDRNEVAGCLGLTEVLG